MITQEMRTPQTEAGAIHIHTYALYSNTHPHAAHHRAHTHTHAVGIRKAKSCRLAVGATGVASSACRLPAVGAVQANTV